MAKNYTKDELATWFEEKASEVSGDSARKELMNADSRYRPSAFVGNMYFFKYHPKLDEILPLYDKYPLTLILERKSDGFIGLNLHYLSSGQRGTLLGIFDKYKSKYGMITGVTSKGGSSNWDNLMKSVSGTGLESLPRQCIKRYLFSHCQSRFIEIYPNEYDKAIQLKIDEWVIKR